MQLTSKKTQHLKQSGIRSASVRCAKLGGINLGQGVCDIPTSDIIKQQAYDSIKQNHNTYAPCEGIFSLRNAIAKKLLHFNQIAVDPEQEVLVSHGSTGAFVTASITLFNPGDEVILFEPFYGYHKSILELHDVHVKTVPIKLPDLTIDIDDIKKAITSKTRGIVICTPCNPCGKVFSREELLAIGKLAELHNLYVITDEIYEYITYPGHQHCSLASLEDFKHRTVTISGFSKTYNMTGWRLGYAAGPAAIIQKMALVHDLLYVCPPTPLQHAVLAAFELPEHYYQEMNEKFLQKRDLVIDALQAMQFDVTVPQGAYYILANFSRLKFADDEVAVKHLLENAKVATVSGRSFFVDPLHGKQLIRVCFALNEEKINLALLQLQAIF